MWETMKGFKSEAPFSVNDGIVIDQRTDLRGCAGCA
jgi:hypothetical protein